METSPLIFQGSDLPVRIAGFAIFYREILSMTMH